MWLWWYFYNSFVVYSGERRLEAMMLIHACWVLSMVSCVRTVKVGTVSYMKSCKRGSSWCIWGCMIAGITKTCVQSISGKEAVIIFSQIHFLEILFWNNIMSVSILVLNSMGWNRVRWIYRSVYWIHRFKYYGSRFSWIEDLMIHYRWRKLLWCAYMEIGLMMSLYEF